MKLLFLFPSQSCGGAEAYALTIASTAAKQGWDVHAAFPKTDGTASLIRDFLANSVRYHPLEIGVFENRRLEILKRHVLRFARTVTLLLKLKPDVVQIVLPWPDFGRSSILACGLLRIPTAVVFQLVPPYRLSFSSKMLKIYAWARSRNQQWIAVSENNQKFICESFQIPYNEVLRIYNGAKLISASVNDDVTTLRYQVRQELEISAESQLVLTVGRLSLQKGYENLIHVVPHIVKEFPNVKFVWVGEGEERDYLVNKVGEYGIEDKILFLGHRSDVPSLLKAADLFVFPARYEGLPFALLEAMAEGLAVIASYASSIPEIIEDKVHGLLFPTGDSCALLEAIRWAMKHPDEMQEMAKNAKVRVQDFSEENMVNETLELLMKLNLM